MSLLTRNQNSQTSLPSSLGEVPGSLGDCPICGGPVFRGTRKKYGVRKVNGAQVWSYVCSPECWRGEGSRALTAHYCVVCNTKVARRSDAYCGMGCQRKRGKALAQAAKWYSHWDIPHFDTAGIEGHLHGVLMLWYHLQGRDDGNRKLPVPPKPISAINMRDFGLYYQALVEAHGKSIAMDRDRKDEADTKRDWDGINARVAHGRGKLQEEKDALAKWTDEILSAEEASNGNHG